MKFSENVPVPTHCASFLLTTFPLTRTNWIRRKKVGGKLFHHKINLFKVQVERKNKNNLCDKKYTFISSINFHAKK